MLARILVALLILSSPVLAQNPIGPVSGGIPAAVNTALAKKIDKKTLTQLGSTKQVYIWYRTDGVAGIGTQSEPFDGSTQAKFDALMVSLQGITGLHIHLGPATSSAPFQTNVALHSWSVKSGWFIQGAGMYQTYVQMVGTMTGIHFDVQAFKTDSSVSTNNITISDLTVDNNAAGLMTTADTVNGEKYYTSGACALFGSGILLERVRSINSYGSAANGAESFDFLVSSPSTAASFNNTVRFCIAESRVGNYGAPFGIFGASGFLQSGSRVYNCKAYGINNGLNGGFNSGGVNASWVKNCQFENNYFEDCFGAYYQDTGTAEKIRVRGNTVVRGSYGVAFVGQAPASAGTWTKTGIEITDNNIGLQNRLPGDVIGVFVSYDTSTEVNISRNTVRFQTDGSGSVSEYSIAASSQVNSSVTSNIVDPLGNNGSTGTGVRVAGNRHPDGSSVTGLTDTDTTSLTATALLTLTAKPISIAADPTNGQALVYNSGTGKWEPTTLSGGGSVSDAVYGSGWNGTTTTAPSKNAVYDWGHIFDTDDNGKVNVLDLAAGIPKTDASGVLSLATEGTDYLNSSRISDTAYASSWNGITAIAPSKNAVYDYIHQFDTDDDGKVNVLDIGAGIPKTDSGGVVSLATAGTDYTTPTSNESPTNKTFDALATGNVLKRSEYLQLGYPDNGDGTNAARVMTEGPTFGHYTFKAGIAKASNYVIYRIRVPDDLDTTVDLAAAFKFRLGGADTGTHAYYISMADVASSASADSPTFSNEVAILFPGDASGASGDVEHVTYVTLTSWKASLTAGHTFVIKLARDGTDGSLDSSTVDSTDMNLTVRYGSSQ